MTERQIPSDVLDALRSVELQRPDDLEMCERDSVIEFTHLFGYEEAHDWLAAHPQLYFEALHTAHAPDGGAA